ncbi:hypothetical protein MUK60_42770 [Streptomyces sp. LRE541]|uniref:hypothetical protein n=1 Tax=Streptomyces sp. LRE541 TaxID=2931983 RepID=UPI00200C537F|nr:hypothetical protein [Streptomyces sp. LRE541]UPZ33928.1 hypothetical protein MUK60_42770 [Streptomyces sp. LRE541]
MVDDVAGDGAEEDAVVAGVVVQGVEGLVEGDVVACGEDSFRLFDDDAALECGVELFVDGVLLVDEAGLDEADGGGVRECLGEVEVFGAQRLVAWCAGAAGCRCFRVAGRMGRAVARV